MEQSHLLSLPIPLRPPPPYLISLLRKSLVLSFFITSILLIHTVQFLSLSFLFIPSKRSKEVYERSMRFTKECFSSLLIFLVVGFGKSLFLLSGDNQVELEGFLRRDEGGKVVGLKFEGISVFISNHQQYGDWLYIWILLHFANISGALVIVLKASLRWLPIIGPAMQAFKFAFINKRHLLQNSGIVKNAEETLKRGKAFALLLFPEGTLVSKFTRPKSEAFGKTSGIEDLNNLLLPRSTGLLWSLRSLFSVTPKLALYNLTIGYPFVPNRGYAQDFYTLTSTFGLGQAPPKIHIHLQSIPLSTVPLGIIKPNSSPKELEINLLESEREEFQSWMIQKWREKDELMEGFYSHGEFVSDVVVVKGGEKEGGGGGGRRIEFEIKVRKEDYLRLGAVPIILGVVGMGGKAVYSYFVG